MYIYNIRKYERNQMLLTVGCDVTIHTNIGYRTSLGLWAATLFSVCMIFIILIKTVGQSDH